MRAVCGCKGLYVVPVWALWGECRGSSTSILLARSRTSTVQGTGRIEYRTRNPASSVQSAESRVPSAECRVQIVLMMAGQLDTIRLPLLVVMHVHGSGSAVCQVQVWDKNLGDEQGEGEGEGEGEVATDVF